VLVLGTSLGGLNADQVALMPAERSLMAGCLGMVLINIQQTEHDGKATLRIFGKSDRVLQSLLANLGQPCIPQPDFSQLPSRVLCPYDKDGVRSAGAPMMWWDLHEGANIKITKGHNIQGAKQPVFMHIGAKTPFIRDGVKVLPAKGHGIVLKREEESCSLLLVIEGANMRLGLWWLQAAQRGTLTRLPIVNIKPKFDSEATGAGA
jgi:hypothetical protein